MLKAMIFLLISLLISGVGMTSFAASVGTTLRVQDGTSRTQPTNSPLVFRCWSVPDLGETAVQAAALNHYEYVLGAIQRLDNGKAVLGYKLQQAENTATGTYGKQHVSGFSFGGLLMGNLNPGLSPNLAGVSKYYEFKVKDDFAGQQGYTYDFNFSIGANATGFGIVIRNKDYVSSPNNDFLAMGYVRFQIINPVTKTYTTAYWPVQCHEATAADAPELKALLVALKAPPPQH